MKVRKLISELKKMPQNLEVYFSNHDNAEYELADVVSTCHLYNKEDFDIDEIPNQEHDREWFAANPDKCVVLRS